MKRSFIHLFLFALSTVFAINADAQLSPTVTGYTFTSGSLTYTAVTGPSLMTAIPATWNGTVANGGVSAALTIPFTFYFNGVGYTSCYVNSSGYITFGAASSVTVYSPLSTTQTGVTGVVCAMGTQLCDKNWWGTGLGGGKDIVYTTTGSSPNRVFLIQWPNSSNYYHPDLFTNKDVISFQIRLYETTNKVEVNFASGTVGANDLGSYNDQVGLRGGTITDFNNRSSTTSWSTTTAGAVNTASVKYTSGDVPAVNQLYDWVAPPTEVPSTTTLAFGNVPISTASATMSFNLVGYSLSGSSFTVTAPAGFMVSNNGTTWGTTTTIPYTAPNLAGTPVYVQFDPTATGPASGFITFSGPTGLVGNQVAVSGTGINSCTGIPVAGTATASVLITCPSTTTSLNLTGSSAASGIAYQWQYSSDSATWSTLAGATTVPYSFTPTGSYFYRCIVICTALLDTSYSSGVKVNYTSACPCTPVYSHATLDYTEAMTNFSLTGYTGSIINDNGPAATAGYADRSSVVAPVILQQNGTYSGTITTNYNFYMHTSIWIDFNDDGIFSTSECVTPAFGYSGTSASSWPFTISIPIGATVGNHRMRVRNVEDNQSAPPSTIDPCASTELSGSTTYTNFYGETWDYVCKIVALPACTGFPAAGVATTSAPYSCSLYNTTLSLTGSSAASGIGYQWQSSPDSLTWSNISGATTIPYIASVAATTYFRCRLVCTAALDTVYSNGVASILSATVSLPYYESFEGLTANNTLPPCMAATDLGGTYTEDTYTGPTGIYNQFANTGSKFISFGYLANNDFYYTPAFALTAGTTYQFSFYYITDGNAGTTALGKYNASVYFGTSQTPAAMTTQIGTSLRNFNNTTYTQWTGSFTPTASGTYYIGINALNTNGFTDFFWSIDDMALCKLANTTVTGGTACAGGTLGLSATTDGSSYSWTGPNGFSAPGVLSPTISSVTTAATGTYTFSSVNSCGTERTTTTVVVAMPPVVSVTPSSTTSCSGTGVGLLATISNPRVKVMGNDFSLGLNDWTVTSNGNISVSNYPRTQWSVMSDGYYNAGVNTDNITFHSPDNSKFVVALMDSFTAASTKYSETRLISHTFSLVGYDSATLSYQDVYKSSTYDAFENIEISTDGGTTWATLLNYGGVNKGTTTVTSVFVNPESIDLTPYIGMSNLKVSFHFKSGNTAGTGSGNFWAIDSVNVKGLPTITYAWGGPPTISCTSCLNPTVTPGVVGVNIYTLSTSTAICNVNTQDTVNVGAPPTITLGTPAGACSGPSTLLYPYSATTGSPVTYNITWSGAAPGAGFTNIIGASLGGGNISIGIPSGAVVGTTYSGTLVVSSGLGCTSAPYPINVTVVPAPVVAVTSVGTVCTGFSTTIHLSGTSSGTVIYSIDGTTEPSIALDGSGNYDLITAPLSATTVYEIISISNGTCTAIIDSTLNITPSVPGTWIGGTSTDWNIGSNWSCGMVPTASVDVTVPSGTPNPEIFSGTFSCNNISIAPSETITIDAGAILAAMGNVTNNANISGSGNIVLSGTGAQTIDGVGTVNNLTLSNSAGVTIASGMVSLTGTLSLTTGSLNTNGFLTLISTASGAGLIGSVPSGSLITGNVICQQFIAGGTAYTMSSVGRRAFRFLGHPFSTAIPLSQLSANIDITGYGGAASGFTPTYTDSPSAFWFNPMVGDTITPGSENPGWQHFNNSVDSWNPYEGIRVMIRGAIGEGIWTGGGVAYPISPVTLNISGPINQGPLTIPLQHTVHAAGDTSRYNLISNPYPAPVDIGTVITNSSDAGHLFGGAFWVWNTNAGVQGAYEAVPIGSAYNIQQNASFEVAANYFDPAPSLQFDESNKANSYATSLFKTTGSSIPLVKLHLYDTMNRTWDLVYVHFTDNATSLGNDALDGAKVSNADLDFYTMSTDGHRLSVDARNFVTGSVIPLGINTDKPQTFTIKVEDFDIPTGTQLFLHDKYLDIYKELSLGYNYSFTIDADPLSQGNDRLELALAGEVATTATGTITNSGIKVVMTPNPATGDVLVSYSFGTNDSKQLRLIDVSGVCVVKMDLGKQASDNVRVSLSGLASGIYLVEITSGNKTVTQRLIKE